MMISSAKRERCIAQIDSAERNSSAKSRSETRIQRVRRRPVEPQRRGGREPVDGEGGAGQRRRAQRAFIQPRPRIGQPPGVAGQHLHIGQQMVAEGHRLGGLQMGEARHHDARMLGRALGQCLHKAVHLRQNTVHRVAHPEPEIRGYLVVAAARRVQAPRRLADALAQPHLDIGVDVLQRLGEAGIHRPRSRTRSPPTPL